MSTNPGTVFKGIGVGSSPVVGEVLLIPNRQITEWSMSSKSSSEETAVLDEAIKYVANQLDELKGETSGTSAEILEALRVLLMDEELLLVARKNISEGWSAASAFAKAVDEFSEMLMKNSSLAERIVDFQDLSRRVQNRLAGIEIELDLPKTGQYILVGEDFSALETAKFTEAVVGVITYRGSPTSHTAIICKSKGIAAVVACSSAAALGNAVKVLVDPVGHRVVVTSDLSMATSSLSFTPIANEAIISVRANIGDLADALSASKTLAEGVGLLRTELLYLEATTEPTLDEQIASFSKILSAAPRGPIVVRTLDNSEDKPVPFLRSASQRLVSKEPSYRLLADNPEIVELQLKALGSASQQSGREVWVMAPMISSIQEVRTFTDLARSISDCKVGIMIETPAIALRVEQLAGLVDFISVGTNDLAGFLFNADRMASFPGAETSHWQPELIKSLAKIANDANQLGISSAVCGESASDPVFAIVLAGLGFDSVSVSVSAVNQVRNALSSVTLTDAQEIAKAVLLAESAEQAKAIAISKVAV